MRISMILLLLLAVFFLGCGRTGGDDDDALPGGDDDSNSDDDTTLDDDALIDDDSFSDDDSGDDDSDDDDSAIDDDSADPYDMLTPSGPKVTEIMGTSSHISNSPDPEWTRDFEIEKLGDAGISVLRTDFAWDVIEPQDNVWHPEGYDVMVNALVAANINVLAILDYGVNWAMPGGSPDEIDPAVFADYAGYVATHFGDRMRYYEVWNEQNVIRFWKPYPNPEKYGLLLQAASAAVRANDPDGIVLFGGIAPFDMFTLGPYGEWNFLMRVHALYPDVCDWFDKLSIHPYTLAQFFQPETDIDILWFHYYDLTGAIQHARDLVAQIGCPDKGIWLTEIGWPDLFTGTENQAAYLVRSLVLAAAAKVEAWMMYTFWDGPPDAVPKSEATFGLFTWPGEEPQAKPAYSALLTANQSIGQMQYEGDLGKILGWKAHSNRALAFGDGTGKTSVVVWKETPFKGETDEVQVPLPHGAAGWRLISQWGEVIGQGEDEGPVAISAGRDVVYLTFEKPILVR